MNCPEACVAIAFILLTAVVFLGFIYLAVKNMES